MKTPATRVKDFLTTLRNAHNTAFPNGRLPDSTGIGKSSWRLLELYTEAQKERDKFRVFYEQVTRLDFKATPCQYTLVSSAQMYLTNNKIPFNEVEVKYDCGTII